VAFQLADGSIEHQVDDQVYLHNCKMYAQIIDGLIEIDPLRKGRYLDWKQALSKLFESV
jgi:hypothetical protein